MGRSDCPWRLMGCGKRGRQKKCYGFLDSQEESERTRRSRLCRDVIAPVRMYAAGGGHGTPRGTDLQAGEWGGGWRRLIGR